jgi:hypothetical protein
MRIDSRTTDAQDDSRKLTSFLERNNQLTERIRNKNSLRRIPDGPGNNSEHGAVSNNSPELILFRSAAKDSVAGSSQSSIPQTIPSAPVSAVNLRAGQVQRSAKEQTIRRQQTPETNNLNNDLPKRVNIEKVADKVYRLMQRDLILERERTSRFEAKRC